MTISVVLQLVALVSRVRPKAVLGFAAVAGVIFVGGATLTHSRHAYEPGAAPVASGESSVEQAADWSHYSGDKNAQRYSPLAQITPQNVGKLERAFVSSAEALCRCACPSPYSY